MRLVAGGALFLLSGMNAFWGVNMGTCTQGSADELLHSGVLCLLLNAGAAILIVSAQPKAMGWLLLAPALVTIGYQACVAVSLFHSHYINGMSACSWKESISEFGMDGRETAIISAWFGAAMLGAGGLALAWHRGAKRQERNDG